MIFAAKLLLFFEIRKHKLAEYLPFLQKRAKKKAIIRQRRCRTQDMVGRCRQSRLSESNSDAIDKERSGMVCRTMNAAESPIVSGIKEERKTSLLGSGAGRSSDRSSYRGIDRAKEFLFLYSFESINYLDFYIFEGIHYFHFDIFKMLNYFHFAA